MPSQAELPHPFFSPDLGKGTRSYPLFYVPAQGSAAQFDVGDIVLCVAVGILILYFGVGMIVLRVRGHHGSELVPNVEFWKDLPSLIKEGFVVTFRTTRAKLRSATGYHPYESL